MEKQWKGDMFFSHGTNHSKGVLTLIKSDLDVKITKTISDKDGRFVLVKASIQDSDFIHMNIYAPNSSADQSKFFRKIKLVLQDLELDPQSNIILGGDFNVVFNSDLDCAGGKPAVKESVKIVNEI